MSIEQVEKFVALAAQEPALQAQLDAFQKVTDPAGAFAYLKSMVAEANKRGIHFVESDLKAWITAQMQPLAQGELSDEALDAVAGGYRYNWTWHQPSDDTYSSGPFG